MCLLKYTIEGPAVESAWCSCRGPRSSVSASTHMEQIPVESISRGFHTPFWPLRAPSYITHGDSLCRNMGSELTTTPPRAHMLIQTKRNSWVSLSRQHSHWEVLSQKKIRLPKKNGHMHMSLSLNLSPHLSLTHTPKYLLHMICQHHKLWQKIICANTYSPEGTHSV